MARLHGAPYLGPMQNDIIFLHELIVDTTIGILDAEKTQTQRVKIDIEIAIPQHNAATTDHIDSCPVNYAAVRETILDFAQNHQLELVESFAEELARLILQKFNCLALTLSIAKMDIFADTAGCGVRIYREKHV